MKYLIAFLFLAATSCIIIGYIMETEYSEKLIGFGVVGLFLIVFPLFSYHRWKDKKVEDYMLTKENLEKMRERESRK
jgi:hypothetical protein